MMASDTPNPFDPPKSGIQSKDKTQAEVATGTSSASGKLILVSTFDNPTEAHLFRNELAVHEVDARVHNEFSTGIFGASIAGPSSAFWIEVWVLESDADKALQVKKCWLDSKCDKELVVPEWKCQCGEIIDGGFAV